MKFSYTFTAVALLGFVAASPISPYGVRTTELLQRSPGEAATNALAPIKEERRRGEAATNALAPIKEERRGEAATNALAPIKEER